MCQKIEINFGVSKMGKRIMQISFLNQKVHVTYKIMTLKFLVSILKIEKKGRKISNLPIFEGEILFM